LASEEFPEFISVADAASQHKTTLSYWYDQIAKKAITGYKLPGKRGTYLKKADLAEFWQPKAIDVDELKRDTGA
jgi:hypothetical protein